MGNMGIVLPLLAAGGAYKLWTGSREERERSEALAREKKLADIQAARMAAEAALEEVEARQKQIEDIVGQRITEERKIAAMQAQQEAEAKRVRSNWIMFTTLAVGVIVGTYLISRR